MMWYYRILLYAIVLEGIDLKISGYVKDSAWRGYLGGVLFLVGMYMLGAFP